MEALTKRTTETSRGSVPWRKLMGLGVALVGITAFTGCTTTVGPGYAVAPYDYYDPYYYGPYYDAGPDIYVYGGPYYYDGHREYWHRGIENHHWAHGYGGHAYGGHAYGGFHGSARGSGHGSGGFHGGGGHDGHR